MSKKNSNIIPVEAVTVSKPEKSKEQIRIDKRLKELRKLLKKEHVLFAEEYNANRFNGTKAYMAVYPDAKYDSAKGSASDLLTNPHISEYIDLLYERKFADDENDKEWLLKIMREIITLDPTDAMEEGLTDVHVGVDAELSPIIQKVPTMYVKDLRTIPKAMRRWIKSFKGTKDGGFQVVFMDKTPIIHDFGVELGMFKQDTNVNIMAEKLNIAINKPGEVKIANIQQNKK